MQTQDVWQKKYLDRFYRRSAGFIDGTTEFHRLCAKHIPPQAHILEVGSGPDNATTNYLASLGSVHGVDVDAAVLGNSILSKAVVTKNDRYPFAEASFDACVSNYVVEHLLDPKAHLTEVFRLLRPGAAYIFRTPNLLHYVALVSRCTPYAFHRFAANALRRLPEDAHEPYPTAYRMNTAWKIRRMSRETGFVCDSILLVEKEPQYGLSSRLLFIPFMLYERIVNSADVLAVFRANIFCTLRKPAQPG